MTFLSVSTNRQTKKERVREILKMGLMLVLNFYKTLTFDLDFPYSFIIIIILFYVLGGEKHKTKLSESDTNMVVALVFCLIKRQELIC